MYLTEDQVRDLLDERALIDAVRRSLLALSRGEATQPLRLAVPMDAGEGHLLVKPARIGDALATKLIAVVPGNAARGLPTLLATVVLMDPVTGRTRVVMEGAYLTAMRTAAASAVAADALCGPGPHAVALLGSGVLARSHARMLALVRPLAEIRVWSPTPANAARCESAIERHAAMTWARRLRRVFDIDVESCVRCGKAVRVIASIEEPALIERILAHVRGKAGASTAAFGPPSTGPPVSA